MKKTYLILLSILLISCQEDKQNLVEYVNPFIGTGGHGHTYPGVSAPFGMVQLSPDTRLEVGTVVVVIISRTLSFTDFHIHI